MKERVGRGVEVRGQEEGKGMGVSCQSGRSMYNEQYPC